MVALELYTNRNALELYTIILIIRADETCEQILIRGRLSVTIFKMYYKL